MTALAIISCTVGGALVGGIMGALLGFNEGGDFNFAPVIYGPIGATIGAIGGVVIGAVIFT